MASIATPQRATDSTDFTDPLYRSLLRAREQTRAETVLTARLVAVDRR